MFEDKRYLTTTLINFGISAVNKTFIAVPATTNCHFLQKYTQDCVKHQHVKQLISTPKPYKTNILK